MIKADATLTIMVVPLAQIRVQEYQVRSITDVAHYYQMLLDHPGHYLGILVLTPWDGCLGMFVLLDGHRRFCAYVLAGRTEALSVIVTEKDSDHIT